MHTWACRSESPSRSQVTDPLIRAALTENPTPDSRISLLHSDVKTQGLLACDKHTQRKDFFLRVRVTPPPVVSGKTHVPAFHPWLIFIAEKQYAET